MILDFLRDVLSDIYWLMAISVIGSFAVATNIIPKIIFMVNHHKLNEVPGHRSSHTKATPTMGGLAFFIAFILNLFLLKKIDVDAIGLNLAAAMTLIFIIGFKDDLAVSTPRARILVEIVAISMIFFNTGFHTPSFEGFLGMQQIPQLLMDVLHIIIILTIINAYNLIDGVDGLASSIGISILSMLGLIFFLVELHYYFILCLALISMLLAFLRYNFSHENKIFMGDTGSLIIGFSIAFLSLKFLTMENNYFLNFSFRPENKLIIIAAILSVPLFDMLRVIGVRLLNKKSPFVADRNHIHHILIDYGWPHYKIALILSFINYSLAILIFYLASFLPSFYMLLILIVIFLVLLFTCHILKRNITTNANKK